MLQRHPPLSLIKQPHTGPIPVFREISQSPRSVTPASLVKPKGLTEILGMMQGSLARTDRQGHCCTDGLASALDLCKHQDSSMISCQSS